MADNLTPKLLPTDVLQDQRLERPEDDLFTAKAIAGRVAELLAGTQHPVHVGVFGAWGSGKSSFLQLVESELGGLAGKSVGAVNYPKKFRVVRYDAWRYGGQALRRDLIAVASRKLGVKRRRYTEGLFESRQVVRLEVDELLRRLGSFVAGVAALALALGVLGGLVWSGIWLLSELFDGIKDPSDLLKDMSVPWGKVTAVVTGVLAVLNAPSLLGVSVNRSLPSQDDEFARNLRELVREAEMPRMLRWASNWERIGAKIRARSHCKVIFFIDELDRATDREVLDTLTALQTQFAGAKVSVVVAADHDVLESALNDVHRQAGPEREWDPYLSSSDAFLDKVFQHTFTLPPLRSERIAAFARELVGSQPGLWSEIKTEGLLDDVIYALLPSHVTGPRRIKVLLNAYATQTRVAEARGLQIDGMRRELALWVVLQMEFPAFASDLRVDPRLRQAMRSAEPAEGKRARMIDRHKRGDQPPLSATPEVWSAWTKRGQLADYLERTDHIGEVPFDLLFLETAGSAIGLFDERIAEALDRSDEAPASETLRALSDLDDTTRGLAIRYLAEYSRRAFSVGRDKAVTSMAGLLEKQGPEPVAFADATVEAYRPYRQGTVPAEALIGQLRSFMEGAAANVGAVLDDIDSREEFANRAHFVERITFPANLPHASQHAVADWLGQHITCELLSVLVDKEEWRLLSRAVDARPAEFAHVLEIAHAPDDEEPDDVEAPATVATTPVNEDDETADDGLDDGSNAPDWLDDDSLRSFLENLTSDAGDALTNQTATQIEQDGVTPTVAALLTVYSVGSTRVRARLAASVLAYDIDSQLEVWDSEAATCDDLALLATALDAVVARCTQAMDADELTAMVESTLRLGRPLGNDALIDAFKDHLAGQEWDEDPAARLALGSCLVGAVAGLNPERASDMALGESVACLPYLAAGTVDVGAGLPLLELLGTKAVTTLDNLLADAPADLGAVRYLEAQLQLRRRSGHRLPRINVKAVARFVAKLRADIEADATTATTVRNLVGEFFRRRPTENEVLTLLRLGNRAYAADIATWMAATTPGPATNVWIQVARSKYADATVQKLAAARALDARKVEEFLAPMAASDDLAVRQRAVTLAGLLPIGRADAGRAVQTVAVGIRGQSSDETKLAVRLVANLDPDTLGDDAKALIQTAPAYAFRRKVERLLRDRFGL